MAIGGGGGGGLRWGSCCMCGVNVSSLDHYKQWPHGLLVREGVEDLCVVPSLSCKAPFHLVILCARVFVCVCQHI